MSTYEKARYIPVSVGDVVTAILASRTVKGRVVAIKKRYALINERIYQAPLISTADGNHFDASYIVTVDRSQHGKAIPRRENVHRRPLRPYPVEYHGKYRSGHLYELAEMALGNLPFAIDRQVNQNKLYTLLSKEWLVAGLENDIYSTQVNWKKFQRWIHRNWHRIIFTVAELRERETRRQQEYEAACRREMEYDDHPDLM